MRRGVYVGTLIPPPLVFFFFLSIETVDIKCFLGAVYSGISNKSISNLNSIIQHFQINHAIYLQEQAALHFYQYLKQELQTYPLALFPKYNDRNYLIIWYDTCTMTQRELNEPTSRVCAPQLWKPDKLTFRSSNYPHSPKFEQQKKKQFLLPTPDKTKPILSKDRFFLAKRF